MKVAGTGSETMEMEYDAKVDLLEENEMLRRKLGILKAEHKALLEEYNAVKKTAAEDRSYFTGRISGLEFAVRCNGISGGEVRS